MHALDSLVGEQTLDQVDSHLDICKLSDIANPSGKPNPVNEAKSWVNRHPESLLCNNVRLHNDARSQFLNPKS